MYDGTTQVGVVADVQFATTPDGGRRLEEAAPLLAVNRWMGMRFWFPPREGFSRRRRRRGQAYRYGLPEGLVEVNRQPDARRDQKR